MLVIIPAHVQQNKGKRQQAKIGLLEQLALDLYCEPHSRSTIK